MDRESAIQMLREGRVKQWNHYRDENPHHCVRLCGAILSGSNLPGVNLGGVNLDGVNLDGANLEGADLKNVSMSAVLQGPGLFMADFKDVSPRAVYMSPASAERDKKGELVRLASLHGANLKRASLEHAYLPGLDLRDADLEGADLEGAHLLEANLEGASLFKACLGGANLFDADLCETDLRRADLRDADLGRATLHKADLRHTNLHNASIHGAELHGANLWEADLERADVRRTSGVRLNSTHTRNTKFSPNARDPWSILRHEYTGTALFFHLLLLACFLVPYAARTAMWIGVNRAQMTMLQVVEGAADRLEDRAGSGADSLEQVATELRSRSPALTKSAEKHSIGGVLLGSDKPWYVVLLALALIFYNGFRALLTRRVGALRDEEDRSGFSPAWADYRCLHRLHVVTRCLFVVAFASFAWHVYYWLMQPVWLPA